MVQLFKQLEYFPYLEQLNIDAQNIRHHPLRCDELGWKKSVAIRLNTATVQSPPMIIIAHAVIASDSPMLEALTQLLNLDNRWFFRPPYDCNKANQVS